MKKIFFLLVLVFTFGIKMSLFSQTYYIKKQGIGIGKEINFIAKQTHENKIFNQFSNCFYICVIFNGADQ
jgi:hypothetical protein